MEISIDWLTTIQGSGVRLGIPVYSIGSGKPVLGITCCIHGDETASLFIIARLLEYVHAQTDIYGTIHIILVSNPAALFARKRSATLDYRDLNRVGHGRKNGSYTERIGAYLYEFLLRCDIVIDVHEFEMHTPMTAAFIDTGDVQSKTKLLQAIYAFAPELIWVIAPQQQESDQQYLNALNSVLTYNGVSSFVVETTQLPFLTERDIEAMAQALLRVAAYMNILHIAPSQAIPIPISRVRHEVAADESGLWEPSARLMQEVHVGDPIGYMRYLPDMQKHSILAPLEGKVVQIRHRQLVEIGTSIFSIGTPGDSYLTHLLPLLSSPVNTLSDQ